MSAERDERGRLKPGHSVGEATRIRPGDARRASAASIRANTKLARARRAKAAATALTPKEVRTLMRKQYEAALRGDTLAARSLLDRCIGKPGEAPPLNVLTADEVDVSKEGGIRDLLAKLVREVAVGNVDGTLAREVASLLGIVVEAGALEEAKRLAEHLGERPNR